MDQYPWFALFLGVMMDIKLVAVGILNSKLAQPPGLVRELIDNQRATRLHFKKCGVYVIGKNPVPLRSDGLTRKAEKNRGLIACYRRDL